MLIRIDKVKFLKVKLPKEVPPVVGKTLDSMITPMLAIFMFVFIEYTFKEITRGLYLSDTITTYIQRPLEYIMNSVVGAVIVPLNNSIFWTLGIHGSQAMNLIKNHILY